MGSEFEVIPLKPSEHSARHTDMLMSQRCLVVISATHAKSVCGRVRADGWMGGAGSMLD